jgi:high-affinity K+ transport system ATPase subunit B
MHVLIVTFKNGAVEYFGPFPTLFRANEYLEALNAVELRVARSEVVSMIVPYAVVKSVLWR